MRIFDSPPVPKKDEDIFKDVNSLVKENYPSDES